jgi:phosphatidate cytidylyltransferase
VLMMHARSVQKTMRLTAKQKIVQAHALQTRLLVAAALLVFAGFLIFGPVVLMRGAVYALWGIMLIELLLATQTVPWMLFLGCCVLLCTLAVMQKLFAVWPNGLPLTFSAFLLPTVWITDSAAYFGGHLCGGPKLAPSISPGKTVSGALCGWIAGCVWGVGVLAYAHALHHPVAWLCATSLPLCVILGDLAESAGKRTLGIKDSSTLLPGHGGAWDRLDGLLGALFALWVWGQCTPEARQLFLALFR